MASVQVSRVLAHEPRTSLADHRAAGGGDGLEAARRLGRAGTIGEIDAAGLRGRGGAGFPTATKWRTVLANASPTEPATVVVNGAEGEPGSYKDRAILERNPYRVLEGALIAAEAVGAERIVVAMKASFTTQLGAVRRAAGEITAAGWSGPVTIDVIGGPSEYLFGEETALLEVIEGRPPFPRVTPPYRRGADDAGGGRESAADVVMAGVGEAAPTLANNVETLANVPGIVAHGASWFRQLGTTASPGSVVCTVTGSVQRAGIGEVPMGTPLRTVIDELGGGARPGTRLVAALPGVSGPFIPATSFDTPLTYEDMAGAGSVLGTAGFVLFDDGVDLVAVAQGVAHFLAVESCGQCTPCKQDGLAIAAVLQRFCDSNATDADIDELASRIATVTDEARCALAGQQQSVANSLLALFPEALAAHLETASSRAPAVAPVTVAPLRVVRGEAAEIEESYLDKQPDWTYDAADSGAAPAERLATRPDGG